MSTTNTGHKDEKLAEMDPERLKRLAILEGKVRHRKECEARAQQIVERLLNNPISEEFLCDAAQYLHPDHYSDVVEERTIVKMCGYPLCSKPLPKQPKQKYHISVAHNKVYDITERKSYCSNQCYKASKHFKAQISNTAIWARQHEPRVHFEVIPLDNSINKGAIGEVVVTNPSTDIQLELEALEKQDKRQQRKTEEIRDKKEEKPESEDHVKMGLDELAQQVSDIFLIDKSDDADSAGDRLVLPNSVSVDKVEHSGTDIENTFVDSENRPKEHQVKLRLQNINTPATTQNSRTVDPRSNDPMVPISQPKPSPHREQETTDVASAINNKTKFLADLLDKRDTLIQVRDQANFSGVQDANKKASNESQLPQKEAQLPPVEDFTAVSGQVKVSKNSVIDNIRRVVNQQPQGISGAGGTRLISSQRKKQRKPKKALSPLVPIRNALLEWRSSKSIEYLKQSYIGDDRDMSEFDKQYAALGRRVDAMDISGMVGEENLEDKTSSSQPMPDIKQLQRDTKQLELKITEFYKGNMRYPVIDKDTEFEEGAALESKPEDTSEEGKETEREPIMPTVDSHSQMAIRRKIVFDKLDRVMPDLLRPMRLLVQDVAGELRQLINTFSFTATNIILKSAEWTLMAYVLLKLLALRSRVLEESFKRQSTVDMFNIMMGGLGISEPMVQDLVKDVMTPETGPSNKPDT